jgi:hypothetical protein
MFSVRQDMSKLHDDIERNQAPPLVFAIWITAAIGPAGLFMMGAELGLWADLHEWPLLAHVALVIWTVSALAAHRQIIDGISRLKDRRN